MNDKTKKTNKKPARPDDSGHSGGEMVEKDLYLRVVADFENFKKEQAKFAEHMARFASLAVVTKMLDVLDLLDQAVQAAPSDIREQKDWFTGIERVRKEFEDTLIKAGAERMKIEKKEFDPATMEAVGTVPGGESGTVQSQQRAGWTMHGRVIRPAQVIVFQ